MYICCVAYALDSLKEERIRIEIAGTGLTASRGVAADVGKREGAPYCMSQWIKLHKSAECYRDIAVIGGPELKLSRAIGRGYLSIIQAGAKPDDQRGCIS